MCIDIDIELDNLLIALAVIKEEKGKNHLSFDAESDLIAAIEDYLESIGE